MSGRPRSLGSAGGPASIGLGSTGHRPHSSPRPSRESPSCGITPRAAAGDLLAGGRRRADRSARSLRRAPGVESLESRRLLANINLYPLPSATPSPWPSPPDRAARCGSSSRGATRSHRSIPTTHADPDDGIPTEAAYAAGLTEGPDGNVWFTEERVGKIGVFDPSTGSVKEIADAHPRFRPDGDHGRSGRQSLVHRGGSRPDRHDQPEDGRSSPSTRPRRRIPSPPRSRWVPTATSGSPSSPPIRSA